MSTGSGRIGFEIEFWRNNGDLKKEKKANGTRTERNGTEKRAIDSFSNAKSYRMNVLIDILMGREEGRARGKGARVTSSRRKEEKRWKRKEREGERKKKRAIAKISHGS